MNEQMKFPAGTAFGSIGHPIRRKEDARLLTGKGRYTDDFSLDGQTYAAMVRSPHPHARIVRIDTGAAKAMQGVLLVLTGEDCKADALKPIPHSPVPSTNFDMKLTAPRRQAGVRRAAHAAAGRQGRAMSASRWRWWWRRPARRRWTPPKPSRSNTRSCPTPC